MSPSDCPATELFDCSTTEWQLFNALDCSLGACGENRTYFGEGTGIAFGFQGENSPTHAEGEAHSPVVEGSAFVTIDFGLCSPLTALQITVWHYLEYPDDSTLPSSIETYAVRDPGAFELV